MNRLFATFFLLIPAWAAAQNDSAGNDSGDAVKHPVMEWRFDDAKEAGPRAPTYPGFSATNTAIFSDGKQPAMTVKDDAAGDAHPLRFGLNDAITLESWVKVKEIGEGSLVYIVGKGRTKSTAKNQNYALRLKGEGGGAKVSFLFASAPVAGKPGGWHRWTSDDGFASGGWHHVAVSYKFGDPKSIRACVDGQMTKGKWDMDGATDRAPVQDSDELWLGTGNGGGKGNSFVGWLDDVRIWNTALKDETLKARFQFVPPPPVVQRKDVPKGKILVQICEKGMPDRNAWPDEPLKATESYMERAFGFFQEPIKYVETGVRADRANPHLLRAAALVTLPKGKHRLLLRGRGACRLYVDGKPVLTTAMNTSDGSGHGHVAEQNVYLDLGPDFRFAPPGNREIAGEIVATGKEQLVILETIVGGFMGKTFRRPELGETVVAWSPEGTESWQLLTPAGDKIPYNDDGWKAYAAERGAHYEAVNTAARAEARAEHAPYWAKRAEAAKVWLAAAPAVKVPPLPAGFPANNELDHFIGAKIAAVRAQMAESQTGTVDYFKQVQPILEAKCYDCHQGGKAKGGLKLNELAAVLKGGKSDGPAVVIGKPQESSLLKRVTSTDADEVMPPKGNGLTKSEVAILETWIKEGAHWPEVRAEKTDLMPLTEDLAFLRRVYLDTVGVPPTLAEIAQAPKAADGKLDRAAAIDKLLKDSRWADQWMGYWQDVLAENPNILNPTLNNTGPFRWWIYESLIDNKPMDLFVTELLHMKGSERFGGPAGFGVASQNDVPMAAKGTIVSTAFLGVEMKCARCHDAPSHVSKQEQLFQLAAMLDMKTLEVPMTSSVPMDKIHAGGRKSLIEVTLKPGSKVEPKWPFNEFCAESAVAALAEDATDPRDRLATAITAPQNERFAQVIANRVWKRLMGRGIVEPVEDWEKGKNSNPELMKWLGREFVRGGYDVKQLARLILNSHAYQRATDATLRETSPIYTSPAPRRLSAEQVVDSLFAATGKPFKTEEVSLDIDGARDLKNSISLGQPRRAWMLTSTSNERDRPSLSLPRIQAVSDVLGAFGWRGSRQDPLSKRDEFPNTLQPAILSNGVMGTWLTRLSDDHQITELAVKDQPLEQFIDTLFMQLLTRHPTEKELNLYTQYLRPGYESRVVAKTVKAEPQSNRKPELYVSWSNHLDGEATTVRQQQEAAARAGDPPSVRLSKDWRLKTEDVLWSLVNAPEFLFVP